MRDVCRGSSYRVVLQRPAAHQAWILVTEVKLAVAHSQEVLPGKIEALLSMNTTRMPTGQIYFSLTQASIHSMLKRVEDGVH